MPFPDGFLWGVAAAAHQIEGATTADGRGPCVWDDFAASPGAIFDGHSGRVACDHYHRYAEDAAQIADLGANAYRLSISWPRVLPEGIGKPNEAGLDFYDRLIDALLTRGIQPWATLFHWDFPLALQHRGGWLNRDCVQWFGDYTELVVRRLGDRVRHWLTLNELQCVFGLGHEVGEHAPGLKLGRRDVLRGIHHALMAHGNAARVIRECSPSRPWVGWALHGYTCYPTYPTEANIKRAYERTFAIRRQGPWFFNNVWYTDPTLLGHYPEDGLALFGADMPKGFERDMELIHQPMDFFGVNIYQGHPLTNDKEGRPIEAKRPDGYPQTMFHWPVEPDVMYWGTRFYHERYKLPIIITENGCASMDWVHHDGRVHDAPRVDYITRHLCALRKAIDEGVDVRGYFHWSIFDNFEWAQGYRMRFGLIYIDYQTMERLPKDSYTWYQHIILSNGECLPKNLVPLR